MKDAFNARSQPFTCPFCEAHELQPFGHTSARCEDYGGMLSGSPLRALGGIAGLPDAVGRHACECGHPEMRLLPDRVYRCPACGSEVVPAWRNHRKP